MSGSHSRILLHHLTKSIETQVLEISKRVIDEEGSSLRGTIQQFCIRIDMNHTTNTLIANGMTNGVTCISTSHGIGNHCIHLLRGELVSITQTAQQTNDLNLDPRGRDVVIIIVTRKTLFDDLFLNADQRGNEILPNSRIILAHIVQKHHTCGHH